MCMAYLVVSYNLTSSIYNLHSINEIGVQLGNFGQNCCFSSILLLAATDFLAIFPIELQADLRDVPALMPTNEEHLIPNHARKFPCLPFMQ